MSAVQEKQISFSATKEEMKTIRDIAIRAVAMAMKAGKKVDQLGVMMDIEAVHCNGNAMRLSDLLAADDFNFAHDVFGIAAHIDRATGTLKGFFSPRFTRAGGAQ